MVAVIKVGHSIHRILNYNENKVKAGVAACIGAGNYPADPEKISFNMKLNRFLKQMELNENTKRNSVHICLNFHVSESHLEKEKLLSIADTYMERIGFGRQPYLVYQHLDAGHPHLHLITTNIEADGKRIDLHHLGIRKSEPARVAIEKEYDLVRAKNMKMRQDVLKLAYTKKVQYGKSDSRRAIQNVLDAVLNTYKYTSLPELNAVLKQYNVMADRGSESSRVYQHQGLLYRILDEQGNPVGVPIKASSFYNKPTLKYLEERFPIKEAARQSQKARVKNAIDLAFLDQPKQSLQSLITALEKEGIGTVVRQNADGIIYGLTYVDHRTECVFNGSALGKQYSAKGVFERCADLKEPPAQEQDFVNKSSPGTSQTEEQGTALSIVQNKEDNDLLEALLRPEYTSGYVPYELRKEGKKHKKRIGRRL